MKKFNNKYMLIPIFTALISLIILVFLNFFATPLQNVSYQNFLTNLKDKKISKVYLTNTPKIKVELSDGNIFETDNPRTSDFKESLLQAGVIVSEQPLSDIKTVIPISILVLSIVVLIIIKIKSSNVVSKRFLSVDSIETNISEKINHNFDNVAGNDEAKESVKDIVDFLKNPEKYTDYGARMPKGIIFYGEPGTGKTLLAKAVAGEAGVPFFAMSGSDFVQVYVGVGASRIRQLFKKAKSCGKAVIFIDEIDAIGKKRDGSKAGGSEERDQTLNALLTEMSGFNEKEGIIIMAATNRLDMLDSALLRPGRFDRHIEIMLPDIMEREKIISLHLKNKPVGNINIHDLAQKTSYFSGAKIESMLNEAAIIACKENSTLIEEHHVDKAFSIILAGYEKKNRAHIKEKDKMITAYHEAGHALATLSILPMEKVSKVTIIPSTKGAGGYTLSISEDSLYQNKEYLNKKIMILLAGRAAEEIVFGIDQITTGAHNDLKHTTNIALNMISEYGMGKTLGLLNLKELNNLNLNQNEIIGECKKLVDSLYIDVKHILYSEIKALNLIADTLIKKETILNEELNNIYQNSK